MNTRITAIARNFVLGLFAIGGWGLGSTKLDAAVIIDVSAGYDAPPSILGGYTMTPMARNLGNNGTSVSSASDLGLTVGFGHEVTQASIGSGWSFWSHGYTGTVWHTALAAIGEKRDSVTLTLPTGTKAFYFYATPAEVTGAFNMTLNTVDAPDGGSKTQLVNVSVGAHFFGVYTSGSSNLTSLIISRPTGSSGFAFGEFGIFNDGIAGGEVPEPTSMAIFGISGIALIARRGMAKKRVKG
jgi:hypothetical protein